MFEIFCGMIVASPIVLFISSLLRSKYFFLITEVVIFQNKKCSDMYYYKGFKGGFYSQKNACNH